MHRRFENAPDSAKTKALQTVIEMKVSPHLIKKLCSHFAFYSHACLLQRGLKYVLFLGTAIILYCVAEVPTLLFQHTKY